MDKHMATNGSPVVWRGGLAALIMAVLSCCANAADSRASQPLFVIGTPDNRAAEFGLTGPGESYTSFLQKVHEPVVFTVGRSNARAWPYIHPSVKDRWAGARAWTFAIRYTAPDDLPGPLFFIIGLCGGSPQERSKVVVTVNDAALPAQLAPSGHPRVAFNPTGLGKPETLIFRIPAGQIRKGDNTISIRLDEQSWFIYDYVALSCEAKPLPLTIPPERNLLAGFRAGPMAGVDEIVFAVRRLGEDPHWYANFGWTLEQSNWRTYLDGARLCRLNLNTRQVTVLLDDPGGGIRDPQLDYEGRSILFSYRRGGSEYFHLYSVNLDGSNLRQLTDGPYNDIEPIWLPDGDILFVSTRCNRCVNCHTTPTAVLHRCHADGSGIRMLSSNNEHDNTPWMLPSGQVLYTRWEYVDRNQVKFHHLWITSPDGVRQTIYYGNQQAGTTMIDAKPIPGSHKVIASFSPGHGIREHDGVLTLVDPQRGPDDPGSARPISSGPSFRDPWAFSEKAFMAIRGPEIVLMDASGDMQVIYRLPPADVAAGFQCHEPRPVCARQREPVIPHGSDISQANGCVVVADVYQGRNMAGVTRGEIKKLLVLETLPKPMNYTGGMEPLTYGGSFTLERVLGTIPVEPDGSAHAELPALRSVFFVALDEHDLSVKRMQSFMTVMPGETTTCVGCHEQRTETPPHQPRRLAALRRAPSRIQPITDAPDVLDFPRDVQPILNRHCLPCHDCDRHEGSVTLSGDRGPIFSLSYYTITARSLVADGRNGMGNRPPRSIGSSASRLLKLMDGSHHGAKASDRELRTVRLWIETGATYPGTYAALGTGMVGGFEIVDRSIRMDQSDADWPSTRLSVEALKRRCSGCHDAQKPLPLHCSHLVGPGGWGRAFTGAPPWTDLTPDDVRRRWSRDLFYNLSRPDKSLILLAPLAKSAGGLERCGTPVFASASDADYQRVLLAIQDAKARLDQIKRFDMPGFRPRAEWVRSMQRFGILPANATPDSPIDVYATERRYWESFWWVSQKTRPSDRAAGSHTTMAATK
ncbi:MAG: PD40 domain-containing protein [Verrucomicrobia bacterium]|nr:PD40 domain-containing protein [Verrucomicrobiota bacterium]